jgi:hypothetical protein
MPGGLPLPVKENLTKARDATLAAVEIYNKPAIDFRAGNYIVLMVIAWTALFHAVFYRRGIKPWYEMKSEGKRKRYKRIDGDLAHWELAECLRQYFGANNPPERKNLEFILGLRNKIEHRSMPHLDATLFGECQAMLMNFDELLVKEFGVKYGLADKLALAIQFSRTSPRAQQEARRKLASSASTKILDYISQFRMGLATEVLNSPQFRFSVYLVPKIANHEKSADVALEFIHYDSSRPDEMEELSKVVGMIREKRVPVVNVDMQKAGEIVKEVNRQLPFQFKIHHHTKAWQHYNVRPASNSESPEKTKADYCVFDKAHNDYVYTKAWTRFLVQRMSDPEEFLRVTGVMPITKLSSAAKGAGVQTVAPRNPDAEAKPHNVQVAGAGGL